MSASDKKKLRKEQVTAALTEKQFMAQQEAKQLKIYTWVFVISMIAILAITLTILTVRFFENSGFILKSTTAATIGEDKLNTVEMNYYYKDAIDEFLSYNDEQYSSYVDMIYEAIGFNTALPLNQQTNLETNQLWSDYFVEAALDKAHEDYTFYNMAVKEGFQLSAEEQAELDNTIAYLDTYAIMAGYTDAKQYLRAVYGPGADVKSYRQYCERQAIADAYILAYAGTIAVDDAAIREYEKDKVANYNSYTYHCAQLSYVDFREGGTEDDQGNKTYTAAEDNAARRLLQVEAKRLGNLKTLDDLKTELPKVKVNEDSQLAINEYTDQLHTDVAYNAQDLADWLAEEDRKEGDIAAVPSTVTTTDENGNTVVNINSYYVVYFVSKNDNAEPMSNVRHLLVAFQGGEQDEASGETIYSQEEMDAAKAKAEEYLSTWKKGKADEASFIELVKQYSDDTGSVENGGLYENINPDSQYVPNFLQWSISPDRKKGDTEIVETEYGYHIMYYVDDTKLTYRDFMISEELKSTKHQEWCTNAIANVKATLVNTSKMDLDLVLSQG